MQSQEGSLHQELPSLTDHKRKSSLRSLQEIQQRRSANQSARSRQSVPVMDGGFYPNTQQEPLISQRLSSRGRSQMEEAAVDERSQVIHFGKRSPSEHKIRRKSIASKHNASEASQERIPQLALTVSGARSSFKQQLEPLNQQALSQMAQTHRAGSSSQQIGPLFSHSNTASQQLNPALKQQVDDERTARRQTLRGHTGRPSLMMRHAQAQERQRASTFSFQNANPKQVSDFLQAIIQQPLSMLYQKPFDLDSTEPLDSFLDSLYMMVSDNVCDYNEAVQGKMHLATGVRTEVCEDVLQYFAQLQTRNKLLNNAVQFFNEYLTKISELEGDKEQREIQVNKLIQDKEELFLTKYDLEKKLEEMSTALKAAQASEGEAASQMKSLNKKYDAKLAECESLMFRLRHLEEMSQMLEPPMGNNSTTNLKLNDSSDAKPLVHLETFSENLRQAPPSPNPRMSMSLNQQEIDRLRNLQEINRKLELELSLVKETLNTQQNERFNINIDHYVRIQELQNKVQIENKQLRVTNKKLETKIESSNRQIMHLEDKIHAVSKEKELIIVNLKSEIKLLTRTIEDNVKNFETRLQGENARFQKEFQQNFSGQEKRLKDEKDQLVREKADLDTKISQLQNQLEQMAADFSKYRADITKKDIEKEQSITELQNRLKQSGQLNESQTRLLQERIETFNNQNQVLAKQNSIIELKLRLIRDSVETLYKQKMFIVDNIEKSRRDLARESAQVEANMMSENGNQEYLISVKKAVKISQTMVDLGLNAIQNVENIVAFLKIDEVRNLIVNQEQQQSSLDVGKGVESAGVKSKETQQQEIEKLNLLFQQEDIQDEGMPASQVQTSEGLRLKNFISLPEGQDDSKTEDHYYNNCPVELSSILSKVLADTLATFGVKELPMPLQKLVQLGSRKADPQVEQEIYMSHLADSKRMVEERYMQLNSELVTLKKQATSSRDRLNRANDENIQSSGVKSRLRSNNSNNELQEVSNRQNSIQQEENLVIQQKRTIRSNDSRRPQSAVKQSPMRQTLRVGGATQQDSNWEAKLEGLKIQMQEQKIKHKEITMQLASKIVLLEEQLDEKRMGQEQDLSELEQLQRDELERTKMGIQQREQDLLTRSNEFRGRAERAEQELAELRGQVAFLNKEIERISLFQRDFDKIVGTKEAEMASYKENVSQYLNLRVSQRNMFGLTIEISSKNESMINEAMLKYYLNKCLKIDKSKFSFISTDQENFAIQRPIGGTREEDSDEADEEVTVVKIVIEIVDDQDNVDRYFKKLKHQIREGLSLLYDIEPLYLSINLGQCGLSPKDKSVYMRDFHLIKRKGVVINRQDFVVSVLRHRQDPLNFKILAASANSAQGEEYILDLQSRDLFELTEGNHTMLEVSEPVQLIDSIIDNLTIITNASTGVKNLACEHKVYFNPIFVNKHVPQTQRVSDITHKVKLDGIFENTQPSQDSLAFRTTNFRNKQILEHVSTNQQAAEMYKGKIRRDADCQTEQQHNSSISSLLTFPKGNGAASDEVYVSTYQGYQRVGKSLELKIKIEEGQKSGTTLVTFEELRSRDKCQICLLESSQSIGRDRYVIHSECVKFQIAESASASQRDPYSQQQNQPNPEPHLVLLTFERFQEDGYLIKMHDMKQGASEEFFIVKKSNGQYARLTRPAGIEAILRNGKEHEELRNLIFDLTFTLGIPSQQILYANLAASEQQQMGAEEEILQMPAMKKPGQVQENQKDQHITDLLRSAVDQLRIMPAFTRVQTDPYQLPSGVLLQKHDRGELLYRNVYQVRCVFERQQETEHESLISFYVKKDSIISVEVFLFKETQKMSIVSQVSSQELFGSEHHTLSFLQKTEMLDQMMEKMYVLSEGGSYHLKVENEAIPMSTLLEERKNMPPPPPPPVNPDAPVQPPKDRPSSEMGKQHYSQLEIKKKEIQENKSTMLAPERTVRIKTYAQINEKLHDYVAYFILKPEKEPQIIQISPSKKNKAKKQVERQTSISNNIEDIVDFEYILIEVTDGNTESYSTLLSLKRLGAIMMSNPYEMQLNWQVIQSKDKEKLVEYLKGHTKIDTVTNEMKIESFQPNKELILQLYTNEIGGIYIRRDQNDASIDLEKEIVEKKLLMNQEVDMSEYSYDVKLFQVFNRHKDRQALSYSFEIFSLNEPDLVYRYNYALHEQSSYVHSPIHIGYDIINLVENPLSRLKQNEEAKRRGEFSQVFQKYIDNRLLLFVNEQIFPHQISFCLYESSSRLHWQYTFDPQHADADFIQSLSKSTLSGRWNIEIGQLSIMDQGTAERFLALIMNEVLEQSASAQCVQMEVREDNWGDLGDSEALRYDLVRNRVVGGDVSLSLSKMGVDCIKIEVRNAENAGEGECNNAVKFIVNASQRNKFVCKLLKLRDQPMNRILLLTCDLKESEIQIKLIELLSSTLVTQSDAMKSIKLSVLYNYIFREKKATNAPLNQNFIIEQQHLEEALAEVFTQGQNGNTTTQVMDKASKLYTILAGKKQVKEVLSIFQDKLSVSQRRLIANAHNQSGPKGDKQQLILHRKTFYDESHEKLIIVSVSVDCILTRKKGHGTAQLSVSDINQFKLLINEPETGRKMDFTVAIESAFLEEELLQIDLKNVQHLKRMAKILIEERAIIKRVSKESGDDSDMYTVDINLYHINPMNWSQQSPIANNNAANTGEQQQESINKGGNKSKNTNSLDNGASSSIKNVGHIPEDEGSDEFEAMESALAANKALQNVKVSSGQTNLSGMGQLGGQVSLVVKSQSFRHGAADILPPQQSIIEEEGSQEEYEESPDNPHRRAARQLEKQNERYQNLPQDDQEEDLRNYNYEQQQRQDDEEMEERSMDSIAEILFERPIGESAVLQILTPSRRDPYQLFQVRQVRIEDGQVTMRIGIEQEVMDDIMDRAGLSEEDLIQQKPELFESMAEYIIYNVMRK